jgi:phage baseplate assembly protein W
MAIENPHFAFPFTRDDHTGHVAEQEENTEEQVFSVVQVITAWPVGFSMSRPEFGWPFPEFRTLHPDSVDELVNVIRRWEPRAKVLGTDITTVAERALGNANWNVEASI